MIKHVVRTSTYLFLLIMLSVMALDEASLAVGTIQIQKLTVPGGGVGFGFTTDVPGFPNFILNDTETLPMPNIVAGTYVVTEDNPTLSGFILTNIVCTCPGASTCTEDIPNRNVTINLVDDDTATCVFTNTEGTIIIQKETIPVGGIDFGFTTNIPGPGTFTLDDGEMITRMPIPSGTYMVTEDDPTPDGFVLSDIVCDDMGSMVDVPTRTATIDLDPGETITCTFKNTSLLEGLKTFW